MMQAIDTQNYKIFVISEMTVRSKELFLSVLVPYFWKVRLHEDAYPQRTKIANGLAGGGGGVNR